MSKIKKEVDKIKAEVFRYLITKTVSDDDATDKYQEISDEIEIDSKKEENQEEKGDAIDTTSEKKVEEGEEK
jgi:hypothetical protein